MIIPTPMKPLGKRCLLKRANKLTQNVSDIGWNGFNPLLNSQFYSSWVPATLRVLRFADAIGVSSF
jgi:hypothetical protein